MAFKKKWTQGIHFFYLLAFDLNYELAFTIFNE